jgi:DNA helicase-2/ATP-dependent DNA helicase PcrA
LHPEQIPFCRKGKKQVYFMKILEDLNDVQRQAVESTEGPNMIIAGAGSGKTRVLTYKIAYLIHKGVDPFRIMALTFTNKAAREMRERIEGLIGSTEARNVWMGTFHSIFARILRMEADKLGFPQNFTIYDTDDSKSIIKKIIKEQQLDDKVYKPNLILSRISSAKTNLISHIAYNNNGELRAIDNESGRPKTGLLYTLYQERLKRAGAMDFDDLLFNTNILFRDFPEVLLKYQKRFKYFLVDEYQDTNYSQYLIVKRLAARDENLTVVGDDAQSIYAFRGANIENILNMEKDYPDLKLFKLEQNYRSTQNIVNLANSIIKRNKGQIKKTVWTDNEGGPKIRLMSTHSDNEEGNMVARSIFDIKNEEKAEDKEFAILYRTNAQSRAMEEALRRMNIPYRIYGGTSFYSRKEIKDTLAYFRLVINPLDEEALLRVINYPRRGIGKTSLEKMQVEANARNSSLWELMGQIQHLQIIPPATAKKIMEFVVMIKSFMADLPKKNAFELANHIVRASGIYQKMNQERDDDEGVMRFENLEELLNGIKDFSETENDEEGAQNEIRTLDEFMQDVALFTDADDKNKEEQDAVTLMTIHAAKGLEFSYVFIVGLEENLFPSMMSLNSRSSLEEERRLFYVAITRAKKRLFLSYAQSRYKWGSLQFTEPSRFIAELEAQYIDNQSGEDIFEQKAKSIKSMETSDKKKKVWGNTRSYEVQQQTATQKRDLMQAKNLTKVDENISGPKDTGDAKRIQVGMEVFHERFGRGKVMEIEGTGDNRKATVFFNKIGDKKLLLRFAKLKIL